VNKRIAVTVLIAAALGALAMALANALGASPHPMPLTACKVPAKRWSALSLEQKAKYVRCNLRHAVGAIQFVEQHRARYDTRELAAVARSVVRDHRRIVRKARANLRAIELLLHPPQVLPGWVHRAVRVRDADARPVDV
jgi:hypothetical protein